MNERQSVRTFTVGGLHMNVLDELRDRNMLREIKTADLTSAGIADSYVELVGTMKATEYYSLLTIAKVLIPLVLQTIADFQSQIASKIIEKMGESSMLNVLKDLKEYEVALFGLIEKLEADYLTAKQLEMLLMDGTKVIGVVELDVNDPALVPELRAKLSGGRYHVIGKVVSRVGTGETIDLMQKSVLSEAIHLIKRLWTVIDTYEKANSAAMKENPDSARSSLAEGIETIRGAIPKLNSVVNTSIQGPAVRVSAMSICI